ncbi:MAG: hexokinase [Kiritimatiellae bacterium]|nr:hexokinase [Kiritimatiellia bacterium]
MKSDIESFISRHALMPESIDPAALLEAFLSEMLNGLAGIGSSLAMIPSYVSTGRDVPVGKPVIVIDAGGTNLRTCVVEFDADGRPAISRFSKSHMPGTDTEVSADEFFEQIASSVRPLLPFAKDIGFCFSYACEISPECDGRLLHWTKQIKAPQVVGMWVGKALRDKLPGFNGRITVINDTVGTLLAGLGEGIKRRYDGNVGFILGTGTNIAVVADNASITKVPGLAAGSMIINAESAGFDKTPQTDIDLAFHATTIDPGKAPFEKMISGGYLGSLGLVALRTAADEGLFSAPFAKALASWATLENKDLDDFTEDPLSSPGPFATAEMTDGDRIAAQAVSAALYKRAATLTAVNLAAGILIGGGGKNPLAPVCVNADGSTFYKTRCVEFRSHVESALRLLVEPRGVSYRIVGVPESPIVGAAVAGLSR